LSSLIVEISRIEAVAPHPNADALELGQIKGWQVCVPKGKYAPGDLVTYVPIDAVIPVEHSDRWGITKYLSNGRVRCARLRGEPSFGVVLDRELDWPEGADVAAHYGITKYEPPLRLNAGDAEPEHALFFRYSEVENMRNFPAIFTSDEPVIVTEKIHGTNCRVGIVEGQVVAGSRLQQRKRPEGDAFERSTYWFPYSLESVKSLLHSVQETGARQVILFGEVYGSKIQSLDYGCKGKLGFRAFDLLVDGDWVDWHAFTGLCETHGVEWVPEIWTGPFSLDQIRQVASGQTQLEAGHIREGVVVKPLKGRRHPALGRVVLKYISDEYLFGKGITDSLDV